MGDPVGATSASTGKQQVYEIKTKNQGTIKYTLKEGGKLEYKETKDGYINFYGNDAKIILPENTASKVRTGGGHSIGSKLNGGYYYNSENLDIVDGSESGGYYADKIEIYGDNNSYTAARKTDTKGNPIWARSSSKGDDITVADGDNNQVNARSGNNVNVAGDTYSTEVEAYQGTKVDASGFGTLVTSKSSPDTKKENPVSYVEVNSSNLTTSVVAEDGSFTIVNGEAMVKDEQGQDITDMEGLNGQRAYYKQ